MADFNALIQSITDAQAANDAFQQTIADSLAQKNQALADKDATIAAQEATIADLNAQLAGVITPAQADQAITAIAALQADISSTPTA